MKGTYVERDRKKERTKRVKPEGGGSKKAAQAAAGAMVAGVPAAMPVSYIFVLFYFCCKLSFSVGRLVWLNHPISTSTGSPVGEGCKLSSLRTANGLACALNFWVPTLVANY